MSYPCPRVDTHVSRPERRNKYILLDRILVFVSWENLKMKQQNHPLAEILQKSATSQNAKRLWCLYMINSEVQNETGSALQEGVIETEVWWNKNDGFTLD